MAFLTLFQNKTCCNQISIYIKVAFLLFMAINAGDKWENDRGDPEFPTGEGGPKEGALTYYSAKFSQHCMKMKKSGPAGGGGGGVQNVTM